MTPLKPIRDSLAARKVRMKKILAILRPLYGADPIEIDYETPFQLVVGVILSAQCTDRRVNLVTKTFFDRLKTPQDFLSISIEELEALIKSTGFYRNKAKNILGAAKMILEDFSGTIPQTLAELVRLPGFGRKTANVILNELYDLQEGIAVDTHVLRLSGRLGLSESDQAEKVERDLMRVTPRSSWGEVTHLIILHGRRVCRARKPDCPACGLKSFCPYFKSQI